MSRSASSNTLSSLPLPTWELLKTLRQIYPPNVPTVWNTAIRRFEQCTHLKSIKGYIELYRVTQKKCIIAFVAKIIWRGPILHFHGCFGTRISSPVHLGTLQIPFQNAKGLKNAKSDAQLNFQNAQISLKMFWLSNLTSQGWFKQKVRQIQVRAHIMFIQLTVLNFQLILNQIFSWYWIKLVLQVTPIGIDNTVSPTQQRKSTPPDTMMWTSR